MSFKHPAWLIAAVAVCIVFAALYFLMQRRRERQALRYSNVAFLIAAVQPREWPKRVLAALWIGAVLLAGLSLAGPRVRALVPVREGTVMLCVDTSGSMAATDVQPSRADAALAALRTFIQSAPAGVAAGIVSFAGDAQLVSPPTRDRDKLLTALQFIPPPNGATAIGDALALAQRSMRKSGHRVIVLITDGENNLGSDPMEQAGALARGRITLYTIGIGTNSGALVPGTLQEAGIDEDALRAYAQLTGGSYSRAENATQLRQALAALGRTTTFEAATVDLSLPGALAGAVLMVLAFLGEAWTRSI